MNYIVFDGNKNYGSGTTLEKALQDLFKGEASNAFHLYVWYEAKELSVKLTATDALKTIKKEVK